jgi:hypothetical protein
LNAKPASIETWETALPSRIKTLLLTAPLHRLEDNKGFRSVGCKDQDFRLLCLRIIDATIERMGLGFGASRKEIIAEVRPLVFKAAPGVTAEDADTIVSLAIEELLNERNRRQKFQENYSSLEEGKIISRTFSFHLLEEVSPDGNIYLQVTNEGIHLYAGMLGYNIEDAQIASEVVLHYQISRGRLNDAVQTAREAEFRSIQLEQHIQSLIHAAQRDIRQVDWFRDALNYLKDARGHINQRLQTEKQILNAIEDKFAIAGSDDLAQLATLKNQVNACIQRHMRLHHTVMAANPEYLSQQLQQSFIVKPFSRLPEMDREILQPALKLTLIRLGFGMDDLVRSLCRLKQPQVFTLKTAIEKLLAPIRQEKCETVNIEMPDLFEIPPEPPVFSEEDDTNVALLLADVQKEITLSGLLLNAQQQSLPRSTQQLLVLDALRNFGADDGSESYPVNLAETEFHIVPFSGNDLILAKNV